jgi:two-component system response regulator FixJ
VNTRIEATVHLVDDDDAVRDSLKTLLESYGVSVRAYSSGLEFLANATAWETGCLVLDLHLPVVSGLDLLTMMRQRKMQLPVVFITGRSDKETRERALRGGAIAFLDKPVREDALLAAVHTAFGEERGSAASTADGVEISPAL